MGVDGGGTSNKERKCTSLVKKNSDGGRFFVKEILVGGRTLDQPFVLGKWEGSSIKEKEKGVHLEKPEARNRWFPLDHTETPE